MNKISLILFFVVAIACQQEQPNTIDESTNLMIDELKKENLKLNRTLNERDSLVNNYAKSINDIRLNLSKIRNQQNLIVRKKIMLKTSPLTIQTWFKKFSLLVNLCWIINRLYRF